MFRTMFLEAVNGITPINGKANMIGYTTLVLAFAATTIAAPVAAAIKVATYTGSTSFDDQTGVFALAGTYNINVPFVAVFKYDTSIGRSTSPDFGDELFGGDDFGGTTPISDAKLTINGITRRFESQPSQGYVNVVELGFGIISYGHTAADNAVQGEGNYLGIGAFGFDIPLSLDSNFAGSVNRLGGGFRISTFDVFGNVESNAFGDFRGGTFSVTNAAVPEPASWAMMITGFGMIGGAMRRRTAQLV